MAWLASPEDAHDGGIDTLTREFGGGDDGGGGGAAATATATDRPLERLRLDLLAAARLTQRLKAHERVRGLARVVALEGAIAAGLGTLESIGLPFDASVVEAAAVGLRRELSSIEAEASRSLPGRGQPLNLSSPQQVADVLYGFLGFPPPSSNAMQGAKTTQLTTKDDVLRDFASRPDAHPLPGMVLRYRAVTRAVAMCNAYASLTDADGRLRCEWNNTRTATGRLSSSNPNLQAVGRAEHSAGAGEEELATFNLRAAFVAPPGKVLLAVDYSQIELRTLAHLARDEKLCGVLRVAGDGGDVFKMIWNLSRDAPRDAPVSAEDRDKAKRTVYGVLYGQGVAGLAEKLACSTDAAKGLIDALFRTFPGLKRFVVATKERARATKSAELPSGRHRPLPGIDAAAASARAEAERKAVNTLVQGTAADMMKTAMARWFAAISPAPAASASASAISPGGAEGDAHADVRGKADPTRARLIAQIHDELLFECDDARECVNRVAALAKVCMERAAKVSVPTPVKVSVGRNWATMTPLGEFSARYGTA
jgi:DNA polymerase I-like protein with 3'-5' exonuclease and polymerase domains